MGVLVSTSAASANVLISPAVGKGFKGSETQNWDVPLILTVLNRDYTRGYDNRTVTIRRES